MGRFNLRDRHGMTLVEALIASVIVAVIILSVGLTLAHSIGVQRGAERYAYANNLAREKLESIKNRPYVDLNAGTTTQVTADNQYTIISTITVNMLPGGIYPERTKTIDVKVYEGAGTLRSTTPMTEHKTMIHQRGL